jgi:hypothetical protein
MQHEVEFHEGLNDLRPGSSESIRQAYTTHTAQKFSPNVTSHSETLTNCAWNGGRAQPGRWEGSAHRHNLDRYRGQARRWHHVRRADQPVLLSCQESSPREFRAMSSFRPKSCFRQPRKAFFTRICPAQPPHQRQLGGSEVFDVLAST